MPSISSQRQSEDAGIRNKSKESVCCSQVFCWWEGWVMCHELFSSCGDALKIALQVGRGRESPACNTQPPERSWLEPSAWRRTVQGAHPRQDITHSPWAITPRHEGGPGPVWLGLDLFFPHFSYSLLIQQESTCWKPSKLDFWMSHWYRTKNVFHAFLMFWGFKGLSWLGQAVHWWSSLTSLNSSFSFPAFSPSLWKYPVTSENWWRPRGLLHPLCQ